MRWYNGPHSKLMDTIYDKLMEHIDVSILDDWSIISLYLAREIKQIEQDKSVEKYLKKEQ